MGAEHGGSTKLAELHATRTQPGSLEECNHGMWDIPGIVSINQFHFSCSSISLSYLAHSSRCYSGTISTGLIEYVEIWIDLTNEKIVI
jgi:hypothetical protein